MLSFKQYLLESFNNNAYVFDVDDTLVTTDARVIIRDEQDQIVHELTPSEYNEYRRQPGEKLDFSEFDSPEIFKQTAEPTAYLKVMKKISDAIQEKRSNSVLYILTARGDKLKSTIEQYLTDHGIVVSPIEIHTIGDIPNAPISELKKRVLEKIRQDHTGDVVFFDDDEKNIELAKTIPGVTTRHVTRK